MLLQELHACEISEHKLAIYLIEIPANRLHVLIPSPVNKNIKPYDFFSRSRKKNVDGAIDPKGVNNPLRNKKVTHGELFCL